MNDLLDQLEVRQLNGARGVEVPALQRSYSCICERAVFFPNSECLTCNTPLGYEPQLGRMFSLQNGPEAGTWRVADNSGNHNAIYRRCANLNTAAGCNWLVKTDAFDAQPYCVSCRLNRLVPDLSNPENGLLWGRIENAKRRVISALIGLRLPVASRVDEDPQHGLAFDFLRSPAYGPRVLTGHCNGLITLNIEEADDVKREQMRKSMREPYRTLVGHLRHEAGHYYWGRLIANSRWQEEFRALFGDEREDYAAALRRNYREGARPGWQRRFVSAYASVHPWEDWAEIWAHYMHMVDTLGTALSLGIKPETMAMPFDCFGPEALYQSPDGLHQEKDCTRFLQFVNSWLKLAAVMNELCRSMGQADFYPFALPAAAVRKLHFVHLVVSENARSN